MTKWLQAAAPVSTPADKTDKRDGTQPEDESTGPKSNFDPLLSVLSVLSGGGKVLAISTETATRAAIIRALRAGMKTPGSIATVAKLGATLIYQELDRMKFEGLVTMQPDGALGLTAADLEAAMVSLVQPPPNP